jgi:hypothetical protein
MEGGREQDRERRRKKSKREREREREREENIANGLTPKRTEYRNKCN